MYYPLSQITSNLHTNGGEFAYANTKQEYIGYYYKTSKGEHFTGKTPQDGPNELLITYSKDGGAEITIQNNIYSFVNTDSFEVTKYINITKQSPVAPYPPTYSPTFRGYLYAQSFMDYSCPAHMGESICIYDNLRLNRIFIHFVFMIISG